MDRVTTPYLGRSAGQHFYYVATDMSILPVHLTYAPSFLPTFLPTIPAACHAYAHTPPILSPAVTYLLVAIHWRVRRHICDSTPASLAFTLQRGTLSRRPRTLFLASRANAANARFGDAYTRSA